MHKITRFRHVCLGFNAPKPKAELHYCGHSLSIVRR